ncbi:MAG: hypothetical protein LBU86_04065 [Oscillospiraceae bacterium]|nr:hypothetical protein [Oscillospiraceae bacterium]
MASSIPAVPAESSQPDAGEISVNPAPMPTVNPFRVPDAPYNLYLHHPDQIAYGMLGGYFLMGEGEHDPFITAINALPALEPVTPENDERSAVKLQYTILLVLEDYTKRTYKLYPDSLEVDGINYALAPEQFAALEAGITESRSRISGNGYGKYAQWLVWMNPNRVTAISCAEADGQSFEIPEVALRFAAAEPYYISTSAVKTYSPGSVDFSALQDAFITRLTFDNGVVYTMAVAADKMYLEASDMDVACLYDIWPRNAESYVETMRDAGEGRLNTRTGKPVIYLYPDKTQDVSVKLYFDGVIDYTYPAYNGGWNVTASPDGTLINKADGSEHYYLFWDGTSRFNDWDFSEGFVVKGTDVEGFLRDVLPKLGLIPREYNDFITYWAPEMRKNAYNLITFSTEQYEAIASLNISPAPDTMLRVHMVYKPIPAPIAIKAQTFPAPPARSGFTAVEWGGTRAIGQYYKRILFAD